MALTFEVGNQWWGRARFPAGIFTGTSGRLQEFLSFWREGRQPARGVLTSNIHKSSFLSRFTWPGLLPCPGEQLSCEREAKRYFEGGENTPRTGNVSGENFSRGFLVVPMDSELDTGDSERKLQAQRLVPGEFLFCSSISRDAIKTPSDRHQDGFFEAKS